MQAHAAFLAFPAAAEDPRLAELRRRCHATARSVALEHSKASNVEIAVLRSVRAIVASTPGAALQVCL